MLGYLFSRLLWKPKQYPTSIYLSYAWTNVLIFILAIFDPEVIPCSVLAFALQRQVNNVMTDFHFTCTLMEGDLSIFTLIMITKEFFKNDKHLKNTITMIV